MRLRIGHLGPESEKEHLARLQALRSIALLEFVKGIVVLAAAISLYWLDPSDVADTFLSFLHRFVSPDGHFAHMLFGFADRLSNIKIWHVILVASGYSALRFAEAFGLWRARAWAEWVALISGAVYLPYEISMVVRKASLLHVSILLVNLAVVAFMFYLRIYVPRKESAPANTQNVN